MILWLATLLQGGDLLIADFEGKDYGAWKVNGEAFGTGPAAGTLPNQMAVEGFLGKGLVNSYLGGDAATGMLISPPFKIERAYINFLIGGGEHPKDTCVNLALDGTPIRTSTGRDAERLEWDSWDVAEFLGKTVTIQIVDRHTGGWGHVNVDQIVQSDKSLKPGPAARDVEITGRYLHLPVRAKAPKRRMKVLLGGTVVREFEIELADEKPEFWAFLDVGAWKGKTLRLEAAGPGLDAITQGDAIRGDEPAQRPAFHFTSRRGWLNDPNGLVYHKGEWHLYYQHNPYGWSWGNMHWGHAVSKDLLRWEELPIAIYPPRFGDWAFSGSAVVDAANSSGFKSGEEDVLVGAFTSTGRGECVVYSNDRGRTWKEYEGNPVVKHRGRDPKLLWHAPTKRWVMAVYNEDEGKRRIAFHTSPDLKAWTFQSFIDGYFECPDLFELPLDGDASKNRWVLYAADGKFQLGAFDGKVFTPEGPKQTVWHGNFYAAQTYDNVPDGRRIQIGWAQNANFPGLPFNQQMTVPVELTLRTTEEGPRVFAWPVKEIESLRGGGSGSSSGPRQPGQTPFSTEAERGDYRFRLQAEPVERFEIDVRGVPVVYDVAKAELSCKGKAAPLKPIRGEIQLRILVDRGSIEIFGNEGRVALSVGVVLPPGNKRIALNAHTSRPYVAAIDANEFR
jgi:fructan beta-fructosidase